MQPRNTNSSPGNPTNIIVGVLGLILILAGLYYITRLVMWILGLLTPLFLIGALIIDYRVFINYGKMIARWMKKNPIVGIVAIIFSIVGIPLLAPFLFGKAWFNRKVRKMTENMTNQREGQFIEYEEVPEEQEPLPELDIHNDPRPNPLDKSTKPKGDYDELFEDLDFEDQNPPSKLW